MMASARLCFLPVASRQAKGLEPKVYGSGLGVLVGIWM